MICRVDNKCTLDDFQRRPRVKKIISIAEMNRALQYRIKCRTQALTYIFCPVENQPIFLLTQKLTVYYGAGNYIKC